MRLAYLLSFALIGALIACEPSDPESNGDSASKPIEQEQKKRRVGNDFDGVNEYSKSDIDSLTYTISYPLENGLYYIFKNGRSTIDVLPAVPYTRVIQLGRAFLDQEDPSMTWMAVHRLDKVVLTNAGRPGKIEEKGDGYELYLPFDGATSSQVQLLMEKYPKGKFTLVAGQTGTQIFTADSEFIREDGIFLQHPDRAVLQLILDSFPL